VTAVPVWLGVLRGVRGALLRPLVSGAAVAAAVWVLGMTFASAVVVGCAVAAGVAVVQRIDGRIEPRAGTRSEHRTDGVRGEVLELAWTMVGRDGRAGERALRHLRAAGARRVARHGLDLTDPADADAVRALVGARAHVTLTRRSHPLPSVGDLTHTLGVLERLGAARTRSRHAGRDQPTDSPPPTRRP